MFADNDPSPNFRVAKAICMLQTLYGVIPKIYGKGRNAKVCICSHCMLGELTLKSTCTGYSLMVLDQQQPSNSVLVTGHHRACVLACMVRYQVLIDTCNRGDNNNERSFTVPFKIQKDSCLFCKIITHICNCQSFPSSISLSLPILNLPSLPQSQSPLPSSADL